MKVLISDDHYIVREGIKQIVKKLHNDFLIEEADNGTAALSKINSTFYDLIIMDISMPGISGMDILKILKDRKEKKPILILSIHPQQQYAIRALKLGASGYLCKDSLYQELTMAIETILSGRKYLSPSIAEIILDKNNVADILLHERLSEREFQIMCMIAKGIPIIEIAAKLFISDKTVSTHRMRIMEKMGFKKNTELTIYAINNNLME